MKNRPQIAPQPAGLLSTGSAARLAASSRAAVGLLAFAGIVRAAVLVAMYGQLAQDPDAYREIATNLQRHGSCALDGAADPTALGSSRALPRETYRPTAYRPPLYPLVLAAVGIGSEGAPPLRVAVLHWLLGVATVGLVFAIGRRLEFSDWGAAVAGLIVACDPILLNQSTLVMTETLATFLAAAALLLWLRWVAAPGWLNAALVGGVVGLAALCRPTFLPWLGLLSAVVLFAPDVCAAHSMRRRLGWAAAMLLAAGVVVAPWGLRNYRVFGRPIVATTHGGYTLLLGNNGGYYRHLSEDRSGLPWRAEEAEFQALLRGANAEVDSAIGLAEPHQPVDAGRAPAAVAELRRDAALRELAWESIRRQPGLFARASVDRVLQLWSPLPKKLVASESASRRTLRYATAVWYVAVYLLAAAGVWRWRGGLVCSGWLAALLLCLTFTAVHALYWSNLRMRAPLMPTVALLATGGAAWLAVPLHRRNLNATNSLATPKSG